jgi:ferric-dicitrate binding protein FerR (iron transport regulator)
MHASRPFGGGLDVKEHAQWLEQIARYADGTLDEAEVKQLESALRDDAALRREFIEYLNVDSAIAECAALPEDDADWDAVPEPDWRLAWPSRLTTIAAIAASLLLVTATSFWFQRDPGGKVDALAAAVEVLSAEQAEAEGEPGTFQTGDRLQVTRLQLKRGSLQLRLASGVVLDLLGPMEASFEGPSRLRLAHGRMSADVGENGKGFTVATEAGEIVDLGTRFGVDVSDGEAHVAVFSGEVRVQGTGVGKRDKPITIVEGEALQLRKGKRPSRLCSVPVTRDGMRLENANVTPAVDSITDNAEGSDFRRFYGVIAGGMGEGTRAYSDNRRAIWRAIEGESFPQELVGADVVCPFHTDRHEKSLTITLHLAGPADVYVMHDARKPPLEWLEEGFVDTGLMLRTGPWRNIPVVRGIEPDSAGQIFAHYTVWRKRVANGGTVQLGPPHVGGEGADKTMYGIAVKPLLRNATPTPLK